MRCGLTGLRYFGFVTTTPLIPASHELPAAVQALRTERERVFVWHYMLNGANGAAAAKAAGYSNKADGAKVRAHELLLRPAIQDALRELSTKYLFSLAPKALFRLGELLDKSDHKHHAKAIEMTLSRTGFQERTSLDVSVSGKVEVDHTHAAVEDLRRMVALGVPREKLIETFGFSGLSRYEKLLAASEDAKLIEHKAGE